MPNGNCFVHLHEQGSSRRGASFCVPFDILRIWQCGPVIRQCIARSPEGLEANLMPVYDLYLPAPRGYSREAAFLYHVTTRNFFARLCNKPVVGQYLGTALVNLQQRLQMWCDGDDLYQDFRTYLDAVKYLDFANRPEHALACLHYAEHFAILGLWSDAFAHCVGMNDRLYECGGFKVISHILFHTSFAACR
jgi:hypothetical protein